MDERGGYLPRYTSIHRAIALGSLLLLVLVVWSALTDVEIVVTAPAAARPVSGVAELRAPDTRHVVRVLVEEGQTVTKGQAVVLLESRLLEAQRRSAARALASRRRALVDSRAVAEALATGAGADGAPTRRSRLRILEHLSRLAQLDHEIDALGSDLQAADAGARASRRLLGIQQQRHRAAGAAFEQGALSRFDLLRSRRELLLQRAEVNELEGRARTLRERLSARRNARRGGEAEQRRSLLESITALEVEVAELETRLAEVDHRRRQGRITAPVAGVLDQLRVGAGDFVQRGEPMGVVVPSTAAVIFETRIAPRQAAFLRAGQPCRIKLDALPFARYGALPCTLEMLGRDVVETDDGRGYYLARVRPATWNLRADGQPVELQPGATGWVDIIAGRRTVLSFVTEPLRRFARESLRER